MNKIQVPLGTHRFVILGFLERKGRRSPFEKKWRYALVDDRRISYESYSGLVRLGLKSDPSIEILDHFVFPPPPDSGPESVKAYNHGFTRQPTKDRPMLASKGFHSRKLFQFLEAIGIDLDNPAAYEDFPILMGLEGRECIATVVEGFDIMDQSTGGPRKTPNRIGVFSYRPPSP